MSCLSHNFTKLHAFNVFIVVFFLFLIIYPEASVGLLACLLVFCWVVFVCLGFCFVFGILFGFLKFPELATEHYKQMDIRGKGEFFEIKVILYRNIKINSAIQQTFLIEKIKVFVDRRLSVNITTVVPIKCGVLCSLPDCVSVPSLSVQCSFQWLDLYDSKISW